MAPKKKAAKPLDKKSMKKTKGGLLPAQPTDAMGDGSVRTGRYAGKYVMPTDGTFEQTGGGL